MTNEPGEGGKARAKGAAPAPKNSTKKSKQESRDGAIGCVVLVVLAFLAFMLLKSCVGGGDPKRDEELTARVQCEDEVKAQLKTPSTADVHRGVLSRDANDTIIITGTVDSDNSFGARLTLNYRCASSGGITKAVVSE